MARPWLIHTLMKVQGHGQRQPAEEEIDLINLGDELPLPAYYPDFTANKSETRDRNKIESTEESTDYITNLEKNQSAQRDEKLQRATLVHKLSESTKQTHQQVPMGSYNYSMTTNFVARPLFDVQNMNESGDVGIKEVIKTPDGDMEEENVEKWASQQILQTDSSSMKIFPNVRVKQDSVLSESGHDAADPKTTEESSVKDYAVATEPPELAVPKTTEEPSGEYDAVMTEQPESSWHRTATSTTSSLFDSINDNREIIKEIPVSLLDTTKTYTDLTPVPAFQPSEEIPAVNTLLDLDTGIINAVNSETQSEESDNEALPDLSDDDFVDDSSQNADNDQPTITDVLMVDGEQIVIKKEKDREHTAPGMGTAKLSLHSEKEAGAQVVTTESGGAAEHEECRMIKVEQEEPEPLDVLIQKAQAALERREREAQLRNMLLEGKIPSEDIPQALAQIQQSDPALPQPIPADKWQGVEPLRLKPGEVITREQLEEKARQMLSQQVQYKEPGVHSSQQVLQAQDFPSYKGAGVYQLQVPFQSPPALNRVPLPVNQQGNPGGIPVFTQAQPPPVQPGQGPTAAFQQPVAAPGLSNIVQMQEDISQGPMQPTLQTQVPVSQQFIRGFQQIQQNVGPIQQSVENVHPSSVAPQANAAVGQQVLARFQQDMSHGQFSSVSAVDHSSVPMQQPYTTLCGQPSLSVQTYIADTQSNVVSAQASIQSNQATAPVGPKPQSDQLVSFPLQPLFVIPMASMEKSNADVSRQITRPATTRNEPNTVVKSISSDVIVDSFEYRDKDCTDITITSSRRPGELGRAMLKPAVRPVKRLLDAEPIQTDQVKKIRIEESQPMPGQHTITSRSAVATQQAGTVAEGSRLAAPVMGPAHTLPPRHTTPSPHSPSTASHALQGAVHLQHTMAAPRNSQAAEISQNVLPQGAMTMYQPMGSGVSHNNAPLLDNVTALSRNQQMGPMSFNQQSSTYQQIASGQGLAQHVLPQETMSVSQASERSVSNTQMSFPSDVVALSKPLQQGPVPVTQQTATLSQNQAMIPTVVPGFSEHVPKKGSLSLSQAISMTPPMSIQYPVTSLPPTQMFPAVTLPPLNQIGPRAMRVPPRVAPAMLVQGQRGPIMTPVQVASSATADPTTSPHYTQIKTHVMGREMLPKVSSQQHTTTGQQHEGVNIKKEPEVVTIGSGSSADNPIILNISRSVLKTDTSESDEEESSKKRIAEFLKKARKIKSDRSLSGSESDSSKELRPKSVGLNSAESTPNESVAFTAKESQSSNTKHSARGKVQQFTSVKHPPKSHPSRRASEEVPRSLATLQTLRLRSPPRAGDPQLTSPPGQLKQPATATVSRLMSPPPTMEARPAWKHGLTSPPLVSKLSSPPRLMRQEPMAHQRLGSSFKAEKDMSPPVLSKESPLRKSKDILSPVRVQPFTTEPSVSLSRPITTSQQYQNPPRPVLEPEEYEQHFSHLLQISSKMKAPIKIQLPPGIQVPFSKEHVKVMTSQEAATAGILSANLSSVGGTGTVAIIDASGSGQSKEPSTQSNATQKRILIKSLGPDDFTRVDVTHHVVPNETLDSQTPKKQVDFDVSSDEEDIHIVSPPRGPDFEKKLTESYLDLRNEITQQRIKKNIKVEEGSPVPSDVITSKDDKVLAILAKYRVQYGSASGQSPSASTSTPAGASGRQISAQSSSDSTEDITSPGAYQISHVSETSTMAYENTQNHPAYDSRNMPQETVHGNNACQTNNTAQDITQNHPTSQPSDVQQGTVRNIPTSQAANIINASIGKDGVYLNVLPQVDGAGDEKHEQRNTRLSRQATSAGDPRKETEKQEATSRRRSSRMGKTPAPGSTPASSETPKKDGSKRDTSREKEKKDVSKPSTSSQDAGGATAERKSFPASPPMRRTRRSLGAPTLTPRETISASGATKSKKPLRIEDLFAVTVQQVGKTGHETSGVQKRRGSLSSAGKAPTSKDKPGELETPKAKPIRRRSARVSHGSDQGDASTKADDKRAQPDPESCTSSKVAVDTTSALTSDCLNESTSKSKSQSKASVKTSDKPAASVIPKARSLRRRSARLSAETDKGEQGGDNSQQELTESRNEKTKSEMAPRSEIDKGTDKVTNKAENDAPENNSKVLDVTTDNNATESTPSVGKVSKPKPIRRRSSRLSGEAEKAVEGKEDVSSVNKEAGSSVGASGRTQRQEGLVPCTVVEKESISSKEEKATDGTVNTEKEPYSRSASNTGENISSEAQSDCNKVATAQVERKSAEKETYVNTAENKSDKIPDISKNPCTDEHQMKETSLVKTQGENDMIAKQTESQEPNTESAINSSTQQVIPDTKSCDKIVIESQSENNPVMEESTSQKKSIEAVIHALPPDIPSDQVITQTLDEKPQNFGNIERGATNLHLGQGDDNSMSAADKEVEEITKTVPRTINLKSTLSSTPSLITSKENDAMEHEEMNVSPVNEHEELSVSPVEAEAITEISQNIADITAILNSTLDNTERSNTPQDSDGLGGNLTEHIDDDLASEEMQAALTLTSMHNSAASLQDYPSEESNDVTGSLPVPVASGELDLDDSEVPGTGSTPSEQAGITPDEASNEAQERYEKVIVVARPWKTPEGTVNRPVLRMMMAGVLMHIMATPGVTLHHLRLKYNLILQPVTLLELLEILEIVGCIIRKSVAMPVKKCSLFSSRRNYSTGITSESEHTVTFEPTLECVIKMGQFETQISVN